MAVVKATFSLPFLSTRLCAWRWPSTGSSPPWP